MANRGPPAPCVARCRCACARSDPACSPDRPSGARSPSTVPKCSWSTRRSSRTSTASSSTRATGSDRRASTSTSPRTRRDSGHWRPARTCSCRATGRARSTRRGFGAEELAAAHSGARVRRRQLAMATRSVVDACRVGADGGVRDRDRGGTRRRRPPAPRPRRAVRLHHRVPRRARRDGRVATARDRRRQLPGVGLAVSDGYVDPIARRRASIPMPRRGSATGGRECKRPKATSGGSVTCGRSRRCRGHRRTGCSRRRRSARTARSGPMDDARIFHVNVNCADLARSRAFYVDAFGLDAAVRTTPEAAQPGAAFGLDRAWWDAWILVGARGFEGGAIDLLEWRGRTGRRAAGFVPRVRLPARRHRRDRPRRRRIAHRAARWQRVERARRARVARRRPGPPGHGQRPGRHRDRVHRRRRGRGCRSSPCAARTSSTRSRSTAPSASRSGLVSPPTRPTRRTCGSTDRWRWTRSCCRRPAGARSASSSSASASGHRVAPLRPANALGIWRTALLVGDLDAGVRGARGAAGPDARADRRDGDGPGLPELRFVCFRGPDGEVIELIEQPSDRTARAASSTGRTKATTRRSTTSRGS